MQVDYRAYPHPVLAYFSDDFVRCLYQTSLRPSVSLTSYRFSVTSKTSSRGLLQLIADGAAHHALHVESPSTRYRRLFSSSNESFDVDVPSECLDGKVQLCTFILAAQDIDAYRNPDFHPDFGGRSFRIKKGDVLAVDRDRFFFAEKDYDPLRKLPSIFTVAKNLDPDAPTIDVDLAGHKVVLRLSTEMFEAYTSLSRDQAMAPVLSSLVIMPALVSVIEMIGLSGPEGRADFEERRWYRVLAEKLRELDYNIDKGDEFADSSLVISQKLIGQPLLAAVRSLVELEESE